MRFLMLAAVVLVAVAGPMARAQEAPNAEMDRAETELRSSLAPSAAAGVAVERRAPDEIVVRMPSDITFDFNSDRVRGQFASSIQALARTLNAHPGLDVQVVGHADAIGSDDYNQRLSERRARAVGAELMDFGVQYDRIAATGRGEWEPIASNDSEWGRARNRRVEIHIGMKKK